MDKDITRILVGLQRREKNSSFRIKHHTEKHKEVL